MSTIDVYATVRQISSIRLKECALTLIWQDMTLLHTLTHPSRIQDVKFAKRADGDGELMLVGAEDKKVTIYQVPANTAEMPSVIAELVGATNR